jgi:hypothetical protein
VNPNPHLEAIWQAFWTLSPSRPLGFGPGAIEFSQIVTYGQAFGFAGSELQDLIRGVTVLDNEFLKLQDEQRPKGK